jgi:MerR family transcriptional regulator, light-induced transcriptional regulator
MDPSSPDGDRQERAAGVPESQACEPAQADAALAALSQHLEPPAAERTSRLLATLRSQVIPRLARAHGFAGSEVQRGVSEAEVEAFTQMILYDGEARGNAHVEALLRDGMPLERLFVDVLAPVARRLGELWVADAVSFADVTVSVGRLQRLLRGLSPAFGSEVERPLHSLRVLLAAAPGEQHTFGLSMVGEFFRRAGWDVTGGFGSAHLDVISECKRQWFDAVGFSIGSETRLDWLTQSIDEVRRHSRNRGLLVMVGGPVLAAHPELRFRVHADLASIDGQDAPRAAQQWVLSHDATTRG